MVPLLILALVVAALDWVAVARGWRRVEYLAKPAVMVILLILMVFMGLTNLALVFFAIGIFFSLGGDVFLMLPSQNDRWFVPGLISFLLAHIAYIAALNIPLPQVSPLWSILLALVLALTASRILRRIVAGLREKGHERLVRPVAIYAIVITLMLLSALLTLNNLDWKAGPAALVAAGAAFFYFSDLILAWNKFVNPIRNGRVVNMILYHVGQIALVAGALLQYRP